MSKIKLDEESKEFKDIKKDWFKQARCIKTTNGLIKFINHLLNDYEHDYGTVVHAISAMALATAWMSASIEGITGFQAGCVMWDFVRYWLFEDNKVGLKLFNYDDMLYPQNEYKYEKTISEDVWKKLKEEAQNKLSSDSNAHPTVIKHWESIVDGKVPFGYEVKS